MLPFRLAAFLFTLIGLALKPEPVGADSGVSGAQGVGLAIVDFAYVDTSGEPADQTAAHRKRLRALMAALRQDFAADGQFRVVPLSCGPAPCTAEALAPADLLRAAAEA